MASNIINSRDNGGSTLEISSKESKVMWIVAAPAIFTRFTTFGLSVISQAFIGHIGSKELAAYALVFTVIIRFANGILVCYLVSYSLILIIFLGQALFMCPPPSSLEQCFMIA